jgi:hypothetical protein
MTAVAKDEQRALARVFPQFFRHQPVEAIEAFAQVARFNGHEYFQAARKT